MLDKSNDLADLGKRLRRERERLGFSVADFGQIGGVNRNSQGEYESGKRPFNAGYALALRERGVDVAYVVTGERSAGSLTKEESELLDCFRRMPQADQLALLQIANAMTGRS